MAENGKTYFKDPKPYMLDWRRWEWRILASTGEKVWAKKDTHLKKSRLFADQRDIDDQAWWAAQQKKES